jgi:hypothetical protein
MTSGRQLQQASFPQPAHRLLKADAAEEVAANLDASRLDTTDDLVAADTHLRANRGSAAGRTTTGTPDSSPL